MIDSILSPETTGTPIPPGILAADAIGAYIAGNSWPTWGPYNVARPDLAALGRIVSITLSAFHSGRCLDVEPRGATNDQAAHWFFHYADRSDGLPIFYTSASNVQALINALAAAGIHRNEYLVWSAHFTIVRHVCAPNTCGQAPQCDGTQYTDHWPGGGDGSVMFDYVFKTPPLPPLPEGVDRMSVTAIAKGDGNLVVFCEATATAGNCGEVFQLYTTQGGPNADGGPVWHGKKGVTPHLWETLGTPGA